MSTRQADPNRAVAFLVKHEMMPRDDAHMFVSYLMTGLVSEIALLDGRYRITRNAGGLTIAARPLTDAEREQEAVDKHACQVCRAAITHPCRRVTLPGRRAGMQLKHPHPERVRKVREEQL